jgi:hypothetical protein
MVDCPHWIHCVPGWNMHYQNCSIVLKHPFANYEENPLEGYLAVGWMWLDFAQGGKHISYGFNFKFFSNLFSLNNRNSPWKKIHWDSHPSNSRLGGEERSSFLNRSYHPLTSPLPNNRASKVYKILSTQRAILSFELKVWRNIYSTKSDRKFQTRRARLTLLQQEATESSKPGE